MDVRKRLVTALVVIIVSGVAVALVDVAVPRLFKDFEIVYKLYRDAIHALVALAVGIIVIQLLASASIIWMKKSREAYLVRNVVLVLGYIVLGFIVAAILGVSGESLLASATFSGLVIGLALQPVLSNFFSGLLILLSGFVKPGQDVRIAGGVPLSMLPFPAYKFFSRDYAVPSLRGRVLEVGLMYTKIADVDGQIIKIPNTTLFNSSVVLEEAFESRKTQIRYEFPVACDPDTVLSELDRVFQEILHDYGLYIEEQSDKQYYIVLLTTTAPSDTKVREFRSRLLKEFIKIHQSLAQSGVCAQATPQR